MGRFLMVCGGSMLIAVLLIVFLVFSRYSEAEPRKSLPSPIVEQRSVLWCDFSKKADPTYCFNKK